MSFRSMGRSQILSLIFAASFLMLVGCGAPGHTVEGKYFGGTYGESQSAEQAYREAFDTGAQKLPQLPSTRKKLAVCYGTPDELKNLSDTSGDPVKGEIFSIIAEGLTKAVSASGIFVTIDTVPSSMTLRECRDKGDDFLLNLTPHASGVGELYNCRTGERSPLEGKPMAELTTLGSVESLEVSFIGQISVVVQRELNTMSTSQKTTP